MDHLYLNHISLLNVQDMQGLLAQVSKGLVLEMQTAESSDLIQQLGDLRLTSVMLINKNQNECWLNSQVDKHLQHNLTS